MLPPGCIETCRGCHHRELTPQESLDQKIGFLKGNLFYSEKFVPVKSLNGEKRFGYRKKVILKTEYRDEVWHFGMVIRDELIDISTCPVHHRIVNDSIYLLKSILPATADFKLKYFLQYGSQICLVISSGEYNNLSWLGNKEIKKFQSIGIEGIWLHYNPSAGRRMFEKTPLTLVWGKDKSLNEHGMYYGIGAFQQLIPELYADSLDEAESFFDLNWHDLVIDLYCGIGQSLVRWSQKCKTAGVELNGFSYKLAGLNVPRATIFRGKCAERIPQVTRWIEDNRNNSGKICLYVNPPRTGLEKEIINTIVTEWRPEKIAYLSCSAGTLKRDLESLLSNRYSIQKIIPYDFFPLTHHVETLVLLKSEDLNQRS